MLRRNALLLLVLPLLASASSCADEGGGLYADVRWRLRCPLSGAHQGCQSGQAHDFQQFDGDVDNGVVYRASCFAVRSGNQLSLSVNAQEGEDFMDVRGVVTSTEGGSVLGVGCTVRVGEQGNTYVGACGPDAPSAAQPCQIQTVVVDRNDQDGKSVTLRMRCERLPSNAIDTYVFDVTDTANINSPSELRFANCRGL